MSLTLVSLFNMVSEAKEALAFASGQVRIKTTIWEPLTPTSFSLGRSSVNRLVCDLVTTFQGTEYTIKASSDLDGSNDEVIVNGEKLNDPDVNFNLNVEGTNANIKVRFKADFVVPEGADQQQIKVNLLTQGLQFDVMSLITAVAA